MSDDESTARLVQQLRDGLAAAQQLQSRYDEVGWRIQEPSWAKTRHLLYHLLRAVTDLALLVESAEHAEEQGNPPTSDEFSTLLAEHSHIAAELVFHASQVANLQGIDLGEQLISVWKRNASTFAPNSEFANLA